MPNVLAAVTKLLFFGPRCDRAIPERSRYPMRTVALLCLLSIAAITHRDQAHADTYQYDSVNRLVRVEYTGGKVIQYTYDAAGNRTGMVIGAFSLPAPSVVGAASRKVHGAVGIYDLTLAFTPTNPTTEPRWAGSGGTHTIVFTFDKAVTNGIASVSEGTATAGAPTFSGNELTVPLNGVTNAQYVTVTVSNVTSADGGTGGAGSVRIGFLNGDVNQNRVVTLADLGMVNAQVAQFVTAANYLKDVNASGTLSLADKGLTNTQITKALPTP